MVIPWWLSCKESTCQCRRWGFDPWVRKIPWSRKWQPTTPVFLPGKFQGQRSLAGYSPWSHKELDMTETEDKMAGWHHRLDGHEFEWTLGFGDGQGGLACCNSWGHKESFTTERLNWTEHTHTISAHGSCRAGFVMRISMAHGSPYVLEPQPEQKEGPLTLSLFWLVIKSSCTTEYEVSEILFDLFKPLVQFE